MAPSSRRARRARPALRRAVSALAGVALVTAALAPGGAVADEDDPADLGHAGDYGTTAPETDTTFRDGRLSGSAGAVPSAYFIELEGTPTAQGGSGLAAQVRTSSFLAQAQSLGADLRVRQTFGTLWSGLSVEADEADVRLAAQSDAVVAVYPVYRVARPVEPATEESPVGPQMVSALGMTGVDEAHELGFTGEGLRIGIVDTGVDVDHPDFGGGGTPTDGVHDEWETPRLRYGYDLVGDDYNADPSSPAYHPEPEADGNPDDCNGHGTHVAGISAADGDPDAGGVVGVAPDAELGSYRVFGCEGSTGSDIILAALELSYEDDMDVVNLSLGAGFVTWPQYPTAVASDTLADTGVVVVASIGNAGESGTWSAGAPGVSDQAIGVASFDNTMVTAPALAFGADGTLAPYFTAAGSPAAPSEGTDTVVRLGDPGSAAARACTEEGGVDVDLTGRLVLVERGVCSFHEKAVNAQQAGAIGVLLYNNVPGMINPTVEGEPPVTIPVVMLFQDDGVALDAAVTAGDDQVTWTTETTSAPNPTAGLVSAFSSYGMTAELGLKPDLGAPGGSIYSTVPLEAGSYGNNSGTSMAAPHAAGAAALLLQADPDLSPKQVRERLQNSADPTLWYGDPSLGLLEGAHRQGAGLIDVDDAILTTASVVPGKLSLGEGTEVVTKLVTISNDGDDEVTYTVANNGDVVSTGAPAHDPAFALAPATLSSPETVTVAPGDSATVELAFTPPTDVPDLQYSGWVELTPDDGSAPLRVPYAGYNGDYQEIEVLTPGEVGIDLPVLGQLTVCAVLEGSECLAGGSWETYPDTDTGDEPEFTLADGDVPSLLVHLEHPARSLALTAYRANADGSQAERVGVVEVTDYLGRSPALASFEVFTWDGSYAGETVPDGRYLLEASVLKALGDPEDPAHTETWTSEPFTITDGRPAPTSPSVSRYSGYDRYATAARISAEFEPGPEVVYIATGHTFPDALTGAARAATDHAPVLLTRQDELPAATLFELDRLGPERIVVLGGDAAISDAVVGQLEPYAEDGVTRLSGPNRYATAAAISGEYEPGVDTAYVATGLNFPDALSGAARAGAVDGPVLLVTTDGVPTETAAELDRLDPDTLVILGGDAAVSDDVADLLGDYAPVDRVFGDDRYGTAAEIARDYEPGIDVAFVATGLTFPDALAGAARAGQLSAPVLLVRPGQIPPATRAELERLRAAEIVILGGERAVSESVEEEIEDLVYGD